MTFKQYRTEHGLKQKELVELMRESGVEITQPTLSMIENNRIDPTVEQAAWLAGAQIEDEGLTEEEEVFLEKLKYTSKGEPLCRSELQGIFGEEDRRNRRLIGSLRLKGYWIVEDGAGYYLTDDPDEFKRWSFKYTAYARTILRTDAAMRRKLYVDKA